MADYHSLFLFEGVKKLIRQDIVICEKCGVLKELFEECGCSEEKEKLTQTDSQNPDPPLIGKGKMD